MKNVSVGKEHYALVDDEDYDELIKFKWYLIVNKNGLTKYALTTIKVDGVSKTILMHKMITGFKQTDHIDRNGLNNSRNNLREATYSQNHANKLKVVNAFHSIYKGVTWDKNSKKWLSRISVNKVRIHLGLFLDEVEAAKAYDAAAKFHYGEFAHPNFEV